MQPVYVHTPLWRDTLEEGAMEYLPPEVPRTGSSGATQAVAVDPAAVRPWHYVLLGSALTLLSVAVGVRLSRPKAKRKKKR